MRYRVPVIAIALLALIGIFAPAASAGPNRRPAGGCQLGPGPYHLKANAAKSLGLTYHGVGNQVTVTPNIGDTTLQCILAPNTYALHNAAGNCIRITDASNDYKVMEESGCSQASSDSNYQWFAFPNSNNNSVILENDHFLHEYLGTEHCVPGNGDGVEGVPDDSGQCLTWILGSR